MIDVGAGVGTVGLALARRAPALTGRLLESDPAVAALANENCRLNAVDDRIGVALCDLFDHPARRVAGLENGKATLIVTNPPFYAGDEIRVSADSRKAKAHSLAESGQSFGHADWLHAALSLLAPKGRFYAIHRPEALPALLAGCEGRLGSLKVVPVHAKADAPAIRILLAGVKGSRAPLRLCPALVLHGSDGAFTPQAEALHRGEALIPL